MKKSWIIPPKLNAEFVYRMEDVLDIYRGPYDPTRPVICVDELSKPLIQEIQKPVPMKSGQPLKFDYHYERNGVRNLFLVFEPLAGQRQIIIKKQRRKIEWSQIMKIIADEIYPDVEVIIMIQDNLNTHKLSSFYEVFEPEEAKRLVDRFEMHYTPKHASWLNMAEIEFSVLSRQCLKRRIPDEITLRSEVNAWQFDRNQITKKVDWQFFTEDARIKLKQLYPII